MKHIQVGDKVISYDRDRSRGCIGVVLQIVDTRAVVDFGVGFDGWKHEASIGDTCWGVDLNSLEVIGSNLQDITCFSTGAVRDDAKDKPKMDLLPWDMLPRLAKWYELGAQKYGKNNWRLGQNKSHTYASLMRHATKYFLGHDDEDHLSAIIWNAFSLMNVDENFKDNETLNDLGTQLEQK